MTLRTAQMGPSAVALGMRRFGDHPLHQYSKVHRFDLRGCSESTNFRLGPVLSSSFPRLEHWHLRHVEVVGHEIRRSEHLGAFGG